MSDRIGYTKHSITKEDALAVMAVLNGAPLTQGPMVEMFEEALCALTGSPYAVVVNSGTAALHLAYGLLYQPGQRVSIPAISFVATANAALYCGLQPRFVDVSPQTGLVMEDCDVGVELGGQPTGHRHTLVDACHSVRYDTHALITVLSFHPAKHIACGEGGALLTADKQVADNARILRSHGRVNGQMLALGFNYRMSDLNAALGLSQCGRVWANITKRKALAARYDSLLKDIPEVSLVPHSEHSHRHLYQIRLQERDRVQAGLTSKGIGTAIHYPVICDQPYYAQQGKVEGLGWARDFAHQALSLPLFPQLTEQEQDRVVEAVKESL